MNHEERCVVYFEKYRTKKCTSDVVKIVIKIRNKKKTQWDHSRTNYKIIFYLKELKKASEKETMKRTKIG